MRYRYARLLKLYITRSCIEQQTRHEQTQKKKVGNHTNSLDVSMRMICDKFRIIAIKPFTFTVFLQYTRMVTCRYPRPILSLLHGLVRYRDTHALIFRKMPMDKKKKKKKKKKKVCLQFSNNIIYRTVHYTAVTWWHNG